MIYQYYERMNTCTTKGAKALRPDLLAGMAEALQALAHADVQKWTEGKEIAKVIVVPGRTVNVAVKG